ncbi:MAG: hypothetical protein RIG84_16910 [Roseovarius sp.]
MKKTFVIAAAAMVLGGPALAWEGQKVACYDKHWVPTTYKVSHHLEMAAKTQWEHADGQYVKVYYPPVYMEKKMVDKPGHYVLRKAPCN